MELIRLIAQYSGPGGIIIAIAVFLYMKLNHFNTQDKKIEKIFEYIDELRNMDNMQNISMGRMEEKINNLEKTINRVINGKQ